MNKVLTFLLISLLSIQFAQASNGDNWQIAMRDVEDLIRNIAIVSAILMIVIGGFQWMTSAGDPGKIGSAKEKIYSAILGLVIIALASTLIYILGG